MLRKPEAYQTPLGAVKQKTVRISEDQIKSISFVITGSKAVAPKKEDTVVHVLRQGFNGVIAALGGKTRLVEGRQSPSSTQQQSKDNSIFSNFLKSQEAIEKRREARERELENRRRAENKFQRRSPFERRESTPFEKIFQSLDKIFSPFKAVLGVLGALGGLLKLFAVAWIAKPENFEKLKNAVGLFLKGLNFAANVMLKVFQNFDKVVIGFLIFKLLPVLKLVDGAFGKLGSIVFGVADKVSSGLGTAVDAFQLGVNNVLDKIKESGKIQIVSLKDFNRNLKKESILAKSLFDKSSKHHKRAVELYTKRMISGAQIMFNSAVGMSKKVSGFMFTGIKGLTAVFFKLMAPLLLLAPLFEAFRKELQPVFENFSDIFNPLIEGFSAAIRGIIPEINNIMGLLGKFISNIAPTLSKVLAVFLKVFARLAETIVPIIITLFEKLIPVFENLIISLMPVFSDFLNELSKVFQELAITVVPDLIDLIKDLTPVIIDLIKEILPALSEVLKALVPVISTLIRVFSVIIKTVLPPLITVVKVVTLAIRGFAMGINFVATKLAGLFGFKLREKIEERDEKYNEKLNLTEENRNNQGKYPVSDAGSVVQKSGLVYVSSGEIILSNNPQGKTITNPVAVPNQPAEIKPIDRSGINNQVRAEALSSRLNSEESETLGEAMKLPYQAVLGGLVGLSEGFVRTLGPAAAPIAPFLKRRVNQMVSRLGLPSEVKMNYNPPSWGSTSPDNTGQGFGGIGGSGGGSGAFGGAAGSGRSDISNQYFSKLLSGSVIRGGGSSSSGGGNFDYGELSKGVELIKNYEGFRAEAYPDPIHGWKVPTIGYGFTSYLDGRPVKPGDKMTKEEAENLLKKKIEQYVKILSQRIPNWNELKPEQKSALLSFGFNVGAYFYGTEGFETITKHLKEKNLDAIAEAFFLYRNKGSGSEVGLGRRRCSEARLWNLGLGKDEYPSVCTGQFKPTIKTSFSKGGNFLTNTYNWIKNKIFGNKNQQTPQKTNQQTPPPPPRPAYNELDIAKNFIALKEGFRADAYPDPIHGWKVPTIGYGFTYYEDGTSVKRGDKITLERANRLLDWLARKVSRDLSVKLPYWNQMSSEQKAAFISFGFNLGTNFYNAQNYETITRRLKNKEWMLMDEALILYRNPGESVEYGLGKRRCSEARLWNIPLKKTTLPKLCDKFGSEPPQKFLKKFSMGGSYFDFSNVSILGQTVYPSGALGVTFSAPSGGTPITLAGQRAVVHGIENAIFASRGYSDPLVFIEPIRTMHSHTSEASMNRGIADAIKYGNSFSSGGELLHHNWANRPHNNIKKIVVHYTATDGTALPTITREFSKSGNFRPSYHLLYENGKIYYVTRIQDLANHAEGHGKESIGISFQGKGQPQYYSDKNLTLMAENLKSLVANIGFNRLQKGSNLFGHSDLMDASDPGPNFPWNKFASIYNSVQPKVSYTKIPLGIGLSDNDTKEYRKSGSGDPVKNVYPSNRKTKNSVDSTNVSSSNSSDSSSSSSSGGYSFEHGMKEFTPRGDTGTLARDCYTKERKDFGIPCVQGNPITNLSMAGGVEMVKQYNGYYAKHPNGLVVRVGDLFGAARPGRYHYGIDIPAHLGSPESLQNAIKVPFYAPVKAKIADVVSRTPTDNSILMTLEEPLKTSKGTLNPGAQIRYVHIYKPIVKKGDTVEAGTHVGTGADTVNNWGNLIPYSHMHLELYESESSSFINPAKYFSPAELVSFPFTGKGIGTGGGSGGSGEGGSGGSGGDRVQSPQEMAKKAILAVACALEAARGGEPSEMCKKLMEEGVGGDQPQQGGSDSVSSDSATSLESPDSSSNENKDPTKIKEPKGFSKLLKRLYDAKQASTVASFFKDIKSLATGYFVSVVGKKLSYRKIEESKNSYSPLIKEGNIDNLIRTIDKKDPKSINKREILSYYFSTLFKEKEKNRDNFGGILVPTELDKLPTPEMNPENFEINIFRSPKLDIRDFPNPTARFMAGNISPVVPAVNLDKNLRLMFSDNRAIVKLLGGLLQYHIINSLMGDKVIFNTKFRVSHFLDKGKNYLLFNSKSGELIYSKPIEENKLSFSTGGTIPKKFIMANPKNYKNDFNKINTNPVIVVNNNVSPSMPQAVPVPVVQSQHSTIPFNLHSTPKSELNNFAAVNNFYV